MSRAHPRGRRPGAEEQNLRNRSPWRRSGRRCRSRRGPPFSSFAACGLLAPAAPVRRLVLGPWAWRVKQRAAPRGEAALLRLLRERPRLTAVGVCWARHGHDLGLRASCALAPGEEAGGLTGGLSDGAAQGPWLCERPDPVPRSHAPGSVQTQVLFAGLD